MKKSSFQKMQPSCFHRQHSYPGGSACNIPNNYALVNTPCLESDILFQPQLRQQPRSLQMSDWLRRAFGLAYCDVLVSFVLLMQSWSTPSRSQPRASLRTVELRPSWVPNVFWCLFVCFDGFWLATKLWKNYCLSCLQLDIRSRCHQSGQDRWRHAVGREEGPLTSEGADGEFRAGTNALGSQFDSIWRMSQKGWWTAHMYGATIMCRLSKHVSNFGYDIFCKYEYDSNLQFKHVLIAHHTLLHIAS